MLLHNRIRLLDFWLPQSFCIRAGPELGQGHGGFNDGFKAGRSASHGWRARKRGGSIEGKAPGRVQVPVVREN